MSESSGADVTRLLQAATDGDCHAGAELLPIVYGELRRVADSWMNKLPPGQTLQPTALVHEAFNRLVDKEHAPTFENRRHFFFVASRAMHDILVERAREKATLKRGGDRMRVSIENLDVATEASPDDLLALEEVLEQLELEHPRAHKMVELRFYAGLTEEQTAEVLDIPLRTAQREWRFIRAWLHQRLT